MPAFIESLLSWYERVRRPLPWRDTEDPYRIWLSEVMLQQTRVATVESYYHRFLERFPTVEDLARASQDEVLKLWEGLGYYSRARNLHRAAEIVVGRFEKRFPSRLDDATSLPGVGRSTAGAVLSIAYGKLHPVLDGNVRRVLIRLHRLEGDPRGRKVLDPLWGLAQEMVERSGRPGPFNQAMMELGALVCRSRTPDCPACPVAGHCQAAARGDAAEFPQARPAKRLPHYHIGVGVIMSEGRVLIQKRPEEGLLGGLWEFPGGKQEPEETIEDCVRREIEEELATMVEVGEKISTVEHGYSHFTVTLHAFLCQIMSSDATPGEGQDRRWVEVDDLARYAFPRANQKIFQDMSKRGLLPWRQG